MAYNHKKFIEQLEDKGEHGRLRDYPYEVRDLGNNTVVVIQVSPDEYPDASYLGSFDDERTDYCIDRRLGVLWGKFISREYRFPFEGDLRDEDGDVNESVAAVRAFKEAGSTFIEDESECYVELSDDEKEVRVTIEGREVIKDNLGDTYDVRRDWKYYHPSTLFKDIDPQAVIDDWNRFEALSEGQWEFIDVSIAIYYRGDCIEEDGMSGIEGDNDYWKELAEEMISGVDIPKLIQTKKDELLAQIKNLEGADADN